MAVERASSRRVRARPGQTLEFILNKVLPFEDRERCLEWPFARAKDGYGRIFVRGKFRVVSRAVCEEAHGPPPHPSMEAAHECGFSLCCNPWHLSWKTHKENEKDKIRHGTLRLGIVRAYRGEKNGRSKLTREQVIDIRQSAQSKRDLAKHYNVSPSTIREIKAGRNWSWLAA